MFKTDPAVIASIHKRSEMLPSLSPSILYHHILPLLRIRKNSVGELQTLWHTGYDENNICAPLLTWPTYVSNILGVGRGTHTYQYWTINMGDNWGQCCQNWQENSFVTDNAHESVAENWSARLDKSDLIQKSKRLETT